MDQEPEKKPDSDASLETPSTFIENQDQNNVAQAPGSNTSQVVPDPSQTQAPQPPKNNRLKTFSARVRKSINIYLLGFGLLIIIALIITYVAYQKNQQSSTQNTTDNGQQINDEVLEQLRNADVKIGDPKQILTVDANAVFGGTVLIKGNFEVAGQLRAEGPINASGANIAGTGTFQNVQTNGLQLAGNGQVQGNLTVQSSLSVSGSVNIGGTLSAGRLNIQSLEIAGDIVVGRHIDASGGNPSKSDGGALGGGGTSSVSGTDTAGTVNINTGSGPSAGCFITVNFTQKFNSTPHVVISPVGSGGSGISYYVNRSNSNFSICSSSNPPAGTNMVFDYIVID